MLPIVGMAQSFYDIIIRNGKIVDGSGNPWFIADVGIKDGKIVSVGNLSEGTAEKVINAKGLIVAPGFIDVHTHIEGSEIRIPTAGNFILDGVTSVITGNCGGSSLNVAEYFRKIDSVKTSVNIATLIGHNTVRRAVLGEYQRDPTPEEQLQMEQLVEKAMQDGAVGLSTGLIYVPGTYSKTEEVVGLAKAASKFGGVYASHIRSEGDNVSEAIDEAISIGEVANMPVEISHFKVTYKPNWGRSVHTLAQVEGARLRGVDVTIDQYPYVASSTTLSTTVPSWVFSGGRDSVQWRLNDKATRLKIKKEMVETLKSKKLKNYNYALVARYAPDSTYNGKTITEVNKLKGRKTKPMLEAETILELIASTERVQMVYFSMDEADLRRILQYPFNMFASDAGINRYGTGMPHPRAYGTNARVLGQYVRDLKIIHLEEAIRRMTSLPASRFNIRDRGLLREGMVADVVIFDEAKVGDRATFDKPHAYSEGFEYIIVNGQITAQQGKHTGVRNGVVLKPTR
ncbi:MAG: D-aminoacylase [Cyclobacteriaceae bacterium]|nr:D-aminoacylase [Cyclobacteriaceae bacterium]